MNSRRKYNSSGNPSINRVLLIIIGVVILSILIPLIIPVVIIIILVIGGVRSHVLGSVKKDFGFLGNNEDFIRLILALSAYIAKADRKVSATEMDYVRKQLEKDFQPNYASKYYELYKKYLQKDISVKRISMKVNQDFNLPAKIQLLHFLVGLIAADGILTAEEEHKIFTIARLIRVPYSSLRTIFAMFNLKRAQEERQQQYKKSHQTSSASKLALAYTILGISPNATDDDIKKAYRKQAKLHHPDRVIHLGKAYQEKAKEKFQKIADAYDLIKEKRRMK